MLRASCGRDDSGRQRPPRRGPDQAIQARQESPACSRCSMPLVARRFSSAHPACASVRISSLYGVLISPLGHGGDDNEDAVKDKAGNASGSHYYSRAYPDQMTRGLARAPKGRCRGALHHGVIRMARRNELEAVEFRAAPRAPNAVTPGVGVALRCAGQIGTSASACPSNSQGFGPNNPESRKVSCLDGARPEVHNFDAECRVIGNGGRGSKSG